MAIIDQLRRAYQKIFKSSYCGFLKDCTRLARYEIGDWTHGSYGIEVIESEGSKLRIGKFCSIASGTTIMLGGEHRADWVTTYAFPALFLSAKQIKGYAFSKGDVTIGNEVWIGLNATILSGVTLGDGMVVGAESVVRRSFPPYTIVMGNPAKLVGYRFSADIISKLLQIRWWDWPLQKIEEAFPLLLSDEIEDFVQKYWIDPDNC